MLHGLIMINALQPRLNLDATPCLERLCSSAVNKPPPSPWKDREPHLAPSTLEDRGRPRRRGCEVHQAGDAEICSDRGSRHLLRTGAQQHGFLWYCSTEGVLCSHVVWRRASFIK